MITGDFGVSKRTQAYLIHEKFQKAQKMAPFQGHLAHISVEIFMVSSIVPIQYCYICSLKTVSY